MAGRIESEEKKTAFIRACEEMNPLKVIPDKILQAKNLKQALSMSEIDATMLYKYGCPCDWGRNSEKICVEDTGKKQSPRYSNQCAKCWFYNLTDEVNENMKSASVSEYERYKRIGLTPEQITELLSYLNWQKVYDFGLLLDTVKDMKRVYEEEK